MKRVAFVAAVLVLGLLTLAPGAGSAGPPKVLEFDTMAAVVGSYVGMANPIREVPGGGLPWAIEEGQGKLLVDGTLEVKVEELVLAAGGAVDTNPIERFRAIVTCQTIDEAGGRRSRTRRPACSRLRGTATSTIENTGPSVAVLRADRLVTHPDGFWFAVTASRSVSGGPPLRGRPPPRFRCR